MKSIILGILFLTWATTGIAQKKKPAKSVKSQASATKKATQPTTGISATGSDTIRLQSISTNAAFAPNAAFRISDPVINLLNSKAAGSPVKVSESGLIGVPKGTYGFANGRIILYSNRATSTGTATGSGSVGTGSSPGTVGSFGNGTGINGKSPLEATGPYGLRVLSAPDTTILKRQ